ncbi:hypothetical protein, partial [Actinomadura montaniterrae]|uniref:hypothetical protein n=1 Tax=Actinomadura montaniterrae TaxID=1803903 RepID=UPI001CEFB012
RGWTARVAIDELAGLCERENLDPPQANIDLLNAWENGRARPRPGLRRRPTRCPAPPRRTRRPQAPRVARR